MIKTLNSNGCVWRVLTQGYAGFLMDLVGLNHSSINVPLKGWLDGLRPRIYFQICFSIPKSQVDVRCTKQPLQGLLLNSFLFNTQQPRDCTMLGLPYQVISNMYSSNTKTMKYFQMYAVGFFLLFYQVQMQQTKP